MLLFLGKGTMGEVGSWGSWGSYQLSVISYQLSGAGEAGEDDGVNSKFYLTCSLFTVPYDTPSVLPSEVEVSRGVP